MQNMTRKTGILATVLIAIGIATAHADVYQSPFGFTVDLPPHWKIVNRESLKLDPSLEADLKHADNGFPDKHLQGIRDGKAELYYDFRDSIYVQTDPGGMKPYKSLEKQICNMALLKKAFAKSFGRTVHIYACRVVRVSRYDAVYMDFDGEKPGTRSLQYQIWKPSNETVIMTLTARNKNLKKLRDEFTALIYSFEAVK